MAIIIMLGFIALIALPTVFWMYSLADVMRNDFKNATTKIVWFVVLCCFPPFATILYFLIGRNQRITFYPVGKYMVFCFFILPALLIIAYILFSMGQMSFIPEPPKALQIQI